MANTGSWVVPMVSKEELEGLKREGSVDWVGLCVSEYLGRYESEMNVLLWFGPDAFE